MHPSNPSIITTAAHPYPPEPERSLVIDFDPWADQAHAVLGEKLYQLLLSEVELEMATYNHGPSGVEQFIRGAQYRVNQVVEANLRVGSKAWARWYFLQDAKHYNVTVTIEEQPAWVSTHLVPSVALQLFLQHGHDARTVNEKRESQ